MARQQQPESTWLRDPQLLDAVVRRLENEHRTRQTEFKRWLRAYWSRPLLPANVDVSRPYRELAFNDTTMDRITGNLTREVVDAALATVCREMQAEVLPKAADFKIDQACTQASRLIEGVFENSEFLSIATQAFRDACTADIGAVMGYIDPASEEIRFQRLNPLEWYWVEDGSGDPRTAVTTTPVNRLELVDRYPKKRQEIMDAKGWSPERIVGVDAPMSRISKDADTVKVSEAWARAHGDNNPGRHTVMLQGGTILEDEKWTHEITPIAECRWSDDFRGFAGVPLARIINPYDSACRRLTRVVYAGLNGAVPWLLTHEDNEIDGVSDVEFQVIKWKGPTPPTVTIPQTVSPEVIAAIERERMRAFAEGGINAQLATGQTPPRYTSAVAQMAFVDIAATRLLQAQKQWEKFWRRAAKIVVMLAAQAQKAKVRIKGERRYFEVKWPSLERDKYSVSFGLASGLSLTPAGQLQDLQNLKDAGVIDAQDVARNLKLPEVEELADRINAPRNLIAKQISAALDDAKFIMPSAMQDLPALLTDAQQEYQRAQMEGIYPAANMEVLRRLILAAKARLGPPQPAAMAPGAPPPGAQIPVNDNAPAPNGVPAAAPMGA